MEIKTDWEIEQERLVLLQKCEFEKLTERGNKRWVAVDELKEELYKICDDVNNLVLNHNLKIKDKYLHTLYLGTVNKMLNKLK